VPVSEAREKWKDYTAIVQSIVTVIAFGIAAAWAIYVFFHQRQDSPRLQITQRVAHLKLSESYNLILVDSNFNNTGPVVVKLRRGRLRTVKVLPLDDEQKKKVINFATLADSDKKVARWWPDAAQPIPWKWGDNEKVIEPGETEHVHSEIVVPASVRSLLVVTYVSDLAEESKEDLGWSAVDMYQLEAQLPAAKNIKRGTEWPSLKPGS
jgi:hypothetical protein